MVDSLPTDLQLDIVTPERLVGHSSVGAVSVPGKTGYLGILPGHAPLLTELVPGEIAYTSGGSFHFLAVSWGFAEVLPDRVIVLARTAEHAEEIDVERAEQAKERAEDRLKKVSDLEMDFERARAALARALARLEAARRLRA